MLEWAEMVGGRRQTNKLNLNSIWNQNEIINWIADVSNQLLN